MKHYDDGDYELVRFVCEDCKIEFEVPGSLVETDRDGGLDFIATFSEDEVVHCPNDRGEGSKHRMIHDISIGAGQ